MKRPKIRHPFGRQRGDYYLASDIDPLLDELERLKADKKPFPSLQEFTKWYQDNTEFLNWGVSFYLKPILQYFSQFQYEKTVFPKVDEEYEFSDDGKDWYKDTFLQFSCLYGDYEKIRHVTTPTREEVIAKYGLTDSDLKALGFDNALRTWIIENTEDVTGQDGVKWNCIERDELLNYMKGQDDE